MVVAMRKNKPIIMKLDPSMFSEKEREILASPSFCVSLFRYRTGVEALRIKIGRGEFIWLPYLGQQLWDWSIDGKSLKFEGFIEEPSYGNNFLQNYIKLMKEERKTEGVNQYLKFSGMGMQMAITIALFAWLGTFLDKKFETDKPLWTAGLSLLGVFAGLYLMLKQLPKK